MRRLGLLLVLASWGCGSGGSTDAASFDASDGSLLGLDVTGAPVDLSPLDAPFVDPAVCGVGFPAYTTMIALGLVDAGSCFDRPTVPCDDGGGNQLVGQMTDVVYGCDGHFLESYYRVVFSEGCPTYLCLGGGADTAAIRACLPSALNASRFACAEGVPFWRAGSTGLP
jgi:hypothetical protein